MNISAKDRERLRALAGKQMELASSDGMHKLYGEWEDHGRFLRKRPMVRIELWTFQEDILPPLMQCEGEEARQIEARLLSNQVNHTLFADDTLVPDYWGVRERTYFEPFGLPVKREETGGLGHHFIPYLSDLADDYALLGKSKFGIHAGAAEDEIDRLDALFGDILPVKKMGYSLYSCPTQNVVHIMNMDDMFVAMYDEPELFGEMMNRLTDDYLEYFRMLEAGGHLRTAAKDQHLAQGTYCFTDALPNEKESARLNEMWLYMDSQETSGVSPSMYAQFVHPYYKKLMLHAGRVSYGCCEAVHEIWDDCLSEIENLTKVSISPWCDEMAMGERLRGKEIVYLRKPSPNLIGVDVELNEQAVREHFLTTGTAARGCTLEVAQRDVYRIQNTPDKVRRYVQLIRETLEETWN